MKKLLEYMAKLIGQQPPVQLRPYQKDVMKWLDNIIKSHKSGVFALRQSRQSGKNEVLAFEHYLILTGRYKGDYLVFSPTYPQTTISKTRLKKYCDHFKQAIPIKEGRIYGKDPFITFLTASPTGNILGHTASLGATIDEAQEVKKEVFETKILPMTASTASPIIMVGTAGFRNDILYDAMRYNEITDPTMNMSIPATMVAACCDEYALHYQQVKDKYGKDSILVRTQYDLEDVSAGGGLLTEEQCRLLVGSFEKSVQSTGRDIYIASIDIGGSSDDPNPKNDCTVLVIAKLIPGPSMWDRPIIEIVNIQTLQGAKYDYQEQFLLEQLKLWNPVSCVVDARGIGEMLCEYLGNGCPIIKAYKASSPSVSQDIHNTLGYLNRGLLHVYSTDDIERKECFRQAQTVGYRVSMNGNLKLEKVGGNKIDIFKSITYLPRAIEESGMFSISESTQSQMPI